MLTPKELRSRRLALGMTGTDLATRLGVPESRIMEWERGEQPIEEPARLVEMLNEMEHRRQSA